MHKKLEKGSVLISIIVLLVVILILGVGYFLFVKPSTKPSPAQPAQDTYASPTMPVTDFAPNLPMSQKTTLIIRDADSSTMKYIVPTDQVDTYIKKLPAGDSVVSRSQ